MEGRNLLADDVPAPDGAPPPHPQDGRNLLDEEAPSPKEPNFLQKYAKWYGDVVTQFGNRVIQTGEGAVDLVKHPVDTAVGAFQDIGHAVTHLPETATGVAKSAVETGSRVLTGDGKAVGDLGFDAATLVAGGAGARAAKGAATEAELAAKARSVLPKEIQHHEVASETAKLPKSDSFETPPDKTLHAEVRSAAETRYKSLYDARNVSTKPEWERFRATGQQLDAQGTHFLSSDAGIELVGDLKKISEGGAGDVTEYSKAMRKSADNLLDAITGVGDKPVNLQVVHETLRELRAKQFDTGVNSFNKVKRERIGALADKLETAMEKWVGPDNYPKKLYAEMSKDLNKFDSTLGQKLTGRQELEYGKPSEGPHKVQGNVADHAFANRESAQEFKKLLGDDAKFDMFAERRVANELRGKSAEQAVEWLGKNEWVKDVPGSNVKVLKYIQVMAAKERNVTMLRWAKSALKKVGYGAAIAGGGYEGYKIASGR